MTGASALEAAPPSSRDVAPGDAVAPPPPRRKGASPAGPVGVTTRLAGGRWLVHAMDTVFSIASPEVAGRSDADALIASIAGSLAATEQTMSVFREDSEISRYRRGEITHDQLSAATREVIAACDHLERQTEGVFSAHWDGGVDPTGYVKGWALARAAHVLDRWGVASYCINGGGDIVARGDGPDGVGWRVGIAHPYRPGELATVVTAIPGDDRCLAVATSGTSERGRHIVNPVDGWRPERSSVTVVGHDIALVDAVATAALAAGRAGRGASAAMVRHFELEAFGFDEDGRPWWTPGMARYALLPQPQGSD